MNLDPQRPLLDSRELAKALGLPQARVWALVRADRIPCVRIGFRTMRFSLPEVERALADPEPSALETFKIRAVAEP